jgi:hypothetical protein
MPRVLLLLASVCFVFTAASPLLGADAAVASDLEAKGAKLKRERDGTVSELSIGPDAKMAPEDYGRMRELKSLKRLSLSPKEPNLNDAMLAAIGPLPSVERFFSNASQFTDDGLKGFTGWTGLRHFGFDHWFGPAGSKGYVGAGLAHLAGLPNLIHVRLGGCRVDNAACEALAKIRTLESIDLFHTFAVTDDGVAMLKALPKLRVVKLGPQWTPRITDASLRHIGEIPTIEEISIVETILTYDGGFSHLKQLRGLRTIDLGTCVTSEAEVARLKADHPEATVKWAAPPEEQVVKVRATFQRHTRKLLRGGNCGCEPGAVHGTALRER